MWNHLRNISPAGKRTHVTAGLHHQSGQLNCGWTTRGFLALLDGLHILIKVRSQKLAQIGFEWTLPSDPENCAAGCDIFPHAYARGRLDFVDLIAGDRGYGQDAAHFCMVGFDGINVST